VGDRADRLADREVLRLENLDTDVLPPTTAIQATQRACARDGANSYLPFLGSDELRAAAADHVGRMSRRSYDTSQCVITVGGLNGILNTLFAVVQPGDLVITTDPIYIGLLNRIRLAAAQPLLVKYHATETGWRLDLDSLEQASAHHPRALLLMSPSMPSGAVLNAEEWVAVADVCRRCDAWLIYDAAMERILFDGVAHIHPASLDGMTERTITVGSASKELRMIGWRVGWVVGPTDAIGQIGNIAISNAVCPVGISQAAVATALAAPPEDLSHAIAEWQARRDILLEELCDWPVVRPSGGWSLLMDVKGLGLSSGRASELLLSKGKIAATPMLNWGSEDSGRYVRFVFSNESVSRLTGVGDRVRSALGSGPKR
jgi:N-succinyldiaminopimelate aminotransferase